MLVFQLLQNPGVCSLFSPSDLHDCIKLRLCVCQGVAVLSRVGANDRTIHPYFVRRMYRLLRENRVDVTYVEIPDKEHWWWDTR